MLHLYKDIFLTDIIGYGRLKFSEIYAPKMKSSVHHCRTSKTRNHSRWQCARAATAQVKASLGVIRT